MVPEFESLIGQVFITGMAGYELHPAFEEHYFRCPSGGFILFGRNVRDAEQLRTLTSSLCGLVSAHNPNCGRPLIGVDQEGGSLSPLRKVVTSLPGNMGLAATRDPGAARYAGYVSGCDLSSLGINLSFAPVLDLARNPANPAVGTRSFGDQPDRVAEFGLSYARGLSEAGVLFTAKHFPGHGSVSEDSHISLPVCTANRSELEREDLVPFRQVIGLPYSAVMAAHVKFTAFDSDHPASLSRPLVTDLLRGDMGFDGVVLTDCLEMNGLRAVGTVPDTAVMAIEAGCDIVLVSHTLELQEAAFDRVRDAVRSGRIGIDRILQSVERIHRWKRGLVPHACAHPVWSWTPELLGERVVSFIPGDAARPWEFGPDPIVIVTPEMGSVTLAEDSNDISCLEDELVRQDVETLRVRCSLNPDTKEIGRVMACIWEHERDVAVGTGRGPSARCARSSAPGS
ncbi:MAG: beta-N-acetylhexosaminidase, partial [Firmicutes bacterium]|nr:beta-N-acetylhexosaminidase [Bacillota bacterium]